VKVAKETSASLTATACFESGCKKLDTTKRQTVLQALVAK